MNGPVERQYRLVVYGDGYRERVAVLAAMREREAGRIAETRRRAVDDLAHERQRLDRARAYAFEHKQRFHIVDRIIVRQCEYRA
ncbi:hypothetical protein D3C87_1684050 [compost metagenome]